MRTVRVSATMLDRVRYYRGEERDKLSPAKLAKFIAETVGDVEPNEAMLRGIRFHKLMEGAGTPGWELPSEIKLPEKLPDIEILKPDVAEWYVLREDLQVRHGWRVKITGRVDALSGRTIIDYKTAAKAPVYERYLDAYQWRCYLYLIPMAETFRYEVFRLKDVEGGFSVMEHKMFKMQRYLDLEEDVRGAVADCVDFLIDLESRGYLLLDEEGRAKRGWRAVEGVEEKAA